MKFHVLGERPKMTPNGIAIPAEWTIFNAPRPLYAGSVTIQNEAGVSVEKYLEWQGKFLHGIFYAAVGPNNSYAIKRNQELDGWEIVYHSRDYLMAWAQRYYETHYQIEDITQHEAFDERHVLSFVLDKLQEQEREM